MLRNPNSLPATHHTRRNHASKHQEQHIQANVPKSTTLDLSMHLPSRASSNRFEVLSIPSPETEPAIKEFYVSNRYRRSRNSRGTKEAKRRRDARRHQRKLAAHMFDLAPMDVTPDSPQLVVADIEPISVKTTPPQLPQFDFSKFAVDTPFPSWCPPSLSRSIWPHGAPTFFDLSSLPEPCALPTPKERSCQELQIWRPTLDLKPKQSKFFPRPASSAKPIVKLPPTACTLHMSEKGLPDDAPSAANLWHILDEHPQPEIAELDGRELPFIHANSLTGLSNDLMVSPYLDDHPSAASEPTGHMSVLSTPPVGLNELLEACLGTLETIDQAETVPLPPSATHSIVLADVLPVDCTAEEDGGLQTLKTSDAHFWNEQSLFVPPTPLSEHPANEPVDIATFLAMGHAKNCWCSDCGLPANTLPADTTDTETPMETPELVPFDKLGEVDDNWMLYSPEWHSSADASSDAAYTATDTGEEEKMTTRIRCGSAPEWDYYFPCKPSPSSELNVSDGKREVSQLATAEDYDWTWDFEW